VATTVAVIVLAPAAPSLRDGVERFLGLVLTPAGNYPQTIIERVDGDLAGDRLLVRVRGPRLELDRLAYALKATFHVTDAVLEVIA
jgi:hypothetical protein